MKKYLVIIFLVLFSLTPLVSFAQVKEEKAKEPATKLEAFLAKEGVLIVKDHYEIGKLGWRLEITALVIYLPGQESQRIRGLSIEVTDPGEYGLSKTSFVDLEEIESLSDAIAYMIDLSEKWKDIDKEYTEVIFFTKGHFLTGFYQKGTKQKALASSGYIGQTACKLSMEDLTSMKAFIDKGAELLAGK